jgi:hypothetical protein
VTGFTRHTGASRYPDQKLTPSPSFPRKRESSKYDLLLIARFCALLDRPVKPGDDNYAV